MSTILIVEDDKNILLTLSTRLRAEGHDVVTAQDAMMAMSVAVRARPDLALLDVSIPAGNGFQVAERLHANSLTSGLPIIFITASRRTGLMQQATAAGAVAFFEKPYEIDALLAAVRKALSENAPAAGA